MAFNKRTWKGRQGTGLNKFSIDGATPVTVINQPDSVTEQGDALSAGNLNDLEDRIYDAFEDIADGTQVVGKATADASGNVITTTYETKADASDLKDAIQFNTKRIENLEQKSGSVVDVDYPYYSVTGEVPTGKAKNAIVSKMRGVSVAYNQLAPSLKTGYLRFNLSETSNPNSTLFTVTGSGLGELYTSINFTVGHKVLVLFNVLAKSVNTISFRVRRPFISSFNSSSGLIGNIGIVSDSSDKNTLALQCDNTSEDDTFELDDAIISYDLTQMFGSSVADYLYSIEQATAGAGVALFRALVSAQDNSYETGRLVSTTYEAVKSVGVNIWNGEKEVGNINGVDGQNTPNNDVYRSVGYIKVKPNTDYYFYNSTAGNTAGALFFYDYNKNYITLANNSRNTKVTTPPNCYYIRMAILIENFGTGVQICLDSASDKTTFHPYMTDTLPLPTSVTLRGILKVVNNNLVVDGDEYNLESGEISRKYALVNLGDLDERSFKKTTNDGFIYFFIPTLPVPPKRPVSSGTAVPRLCSSTAYDVLMDPNSAWSMRETVKSINIPNWADLQILDMDATTPAEMKANLSGVYLFYEAATPTSDSVDPVLDPTLATEGGGTLSTTQTQDPAIVSALEMTYLTL